MSLCSRKSLLPSHNEPDEATTAIDKRKGMQQRPMDGACANPGTNACPCRDLEAAAAVIKKGKTCAVFVEPIQGEGGINPGQLGLLRFWHRLSTAGAFACVEACRRPQGGGGIDCGQWGLLCLNRLCIRLDLHGLRCSCRPCLLHFHTNSCLLFLPLCCSQPGVHARPAPAV